MLVLGSSVMIENFFPTGKPSGRTPPRKFTKPDTCPSSVASKSKTTGKRLTVEVVYCALLMQRHCSGPPEYDSARCYQLVTLNLGKRQMGGWSALQN